MEKGAALPVQRSRGQLGAVEAVAGPLDSGTVVHCGSHGRDLGGEQGSGVLKCFSDS